MFKKWATQQNPLLLKTALFVLHKICKGLRNMRMLSILWWWGHPFCPTQYFPSGFNTNILEVLWCKHFLSTWKRWFGIFLPWHFSASLLNQWEELMLGDLGRELVILAKWNCQNTKSCVKHCYRGCFSGSVTAHIYLLAYLLSCFF